MYKMSSYTQNKLVCDSNLAGRKSVSLKWAGAYAVCFALLWCEIVLPLVKLGIDHLPSAFFFLFFFFLFFNLGWFVFSLIISLNLGGCNSSFIPMHWPVYHLPRSFLLFDIMFFAGLGGVIPQLLFFRFDIHFDLLGITLSALAYGRNRLLFVQKTLLVF